MNYYRRFPGDYLRDTQHLTVTEHGIYNLLLDHLYSTEKPIATIEDCYRISRCTNSRHRAYCKRILSTFFDVDGLGIWHKRVQEELNHLESKTTAGRQAAHVRWKTHTNAMRTHSERNATPDSRLQTPEESKTTPAAKVSGIVSEIPTWIPNDAWNGYTQMRKAMRAPLTGNGISLCIKKLKNFVANGEDVREILEQSTMNGWRGLFSAKGARNGKTGKLSGHELTEHNLRAAGFR